MSLRHAILGVLSVEPMTGYDLLDYFDISAGLFWPAGQAQIYPELRRMERDGLLAATVAPRGKRGKKRIYALTPGGADELRRWANEPPPHGPDRDPVRFKVTYFDQTEPAHARAYFAAHIEHYRARRAAWAERADAIRARSATFLRARLATRDPDEHERIVAFKALALDGAIARADAEIAWAERALEEIDRLYGVSISPSSPR